MVIAGPRQFGKTGITSCLLLLISSQLQVNSASAQQAASPSCSATGECLCDNSFEDCRTPVLDLIKNERVGIDVSFWFMTDWRYKDALIAKWREGKKIRIILDTQADANYPDTKTIRTALANAGIPIRDCISASGINHWKAMIFASGPTGNGKVQFSAANYAHGSLSPTIPYTGYVDEAIYFTDDEKIVKSFKRKYDDYWTDTTAFANYANISTALSRSYPDLATYAIDPSLNFVPGQNFQNRARNEVLLETEAIGAVIFRITSAIIPDALIARHNAGVDVRLITDARQYRNTTYFWHSYNVDRMYAAGIPVKVKSTTSGQDMHQKSLVLHSRGLASSTNAGPMAIFGSSNWTTGASTGTREHNYFTRKTWMVDWFIEQFERKWNNLRVDGTPIGTTVYLPFTPGYPETPAYIAPANQALGQQTAVTLKWEGGWWAHRYDIYLSTTTTFGPPLVADYAPGSATAGVQSTKESYTLPPLQPGTTYYWRIVSKTMANKTKTGPTWSFTTTSGIAVPSAPTGLTATAASASRIDLKWTDVAGEDGYSIERKLSSSATWAQIATTAANAVSYADGNGALAPGTSYNYRVRAFNTGGYSGYSNVATAVTPALTLEADDVVLYAARAPVRVGNWSVAADTSAAGGSLIQNPDRGAAKVAAASASPADYFELTFNAKAGVPYQFWMRARAQNNAYANDSIFVQFNDSVDRNGTALYRIGTTSGAAANLEDCSGCGLSGWGWQDNGWGVNVLGPHIYFASDGAHTIRVQVREDGIAIDQLVLSPSTFLNGSPGALKNDKVVFPSQDGATP